MHTLKKTLISVAAAATLAGGGLASPQIVSALSDDAPTSRHRETKLGDDDDNSGHGGDDDNSSHGGGDDD